MSAYIVGRPHIAYLVESARQLPRRTLQGGRLSWYWRDEHHALMIGDYAGEINLGAILWQQNVKSVLARYPDDTMETAPGVVGESYDYTEHKSNPFLHVDPVQALKACACYRYQSCEDAGWEASEAFAIVGAIEREAIRSLPGYEDAQWEITGPTPPPVPPKPALVVVPPPARTQVTRAEEGKLVKAALAKLGIAARVTHGRGTGWGWMEIHATDPKPVAHDRATDNDHCSGLCPACTHYRELHSLVEATAQKVTGRHGEWGGRINVSIERPNSDAIRAEVARLTAENAKLRATR
jgi:hypothetical protein